MKIQKLNEMLDYYRYLTKEIISFNRFDDENETQKLERQLIVFKYCIENIISESKGIVPLLNIINKTLFENKRKIKEKNNKLNKKYLRIARILIISIIISILLIIIIIDIVCVSRKNRSNIIDGFTVMVSSYRS
ncbi:hypothetical protein L0P52_10045 [Clostridium cochlearium]|nr:hypothetical protein [Clostridium cochlearium]MBV1819983.1 hypothetical protein [Bacteroidales bacterium MSK.15.36]MCG4572561.1 hypothetical protein [Clostridium cochlearium]